MEKKINFSFNPIFKKKGKVKIQYVNLWNIHKHMHIKSDNYSSWSCSYKYMHKFILPNRSKQRFYFEN